MVDAGVPPDVDVLIRLRRNGIQPEYVKEMDKAGISTKADNLVLLKRKGISPELAKQIVDSGEDSFENTEEINQ